MCICNSDICWQNTLIQIYQFILTTYENLFTDSLTIQSILSNLKFFVNLVCEKKWYLIAVSCISLSMHEVEENAFVSEPFVFIPFSVNAYPYLLPILLLDCCLSILSISRSALFIYICLFSPGTTESTFILLI